MKRGLDELATIASTAPLLGLLGTVAGIAAAFKGCGAQRSFCLAATASGLSEALVSTALGLFVAVPARWFYDYFSARLETLDIETANTSIELVSHLTIHLARRRNRR
jgi:biopolymer transport protein ExbB/TolQ